MGLSIKGKTSGHMSESKSRTGGNGTSYGEAQRSRNIRKMKDKLAANSAESGPSTQGNRSNERGRDN